MSSFGLDGSDMSGGIGHLSFLQFTRLFQNGRGEMDYVAGMSRLTRKSPHEINWWLRRLKHYVCNLNLSQADAAAAIRQEAKREPWKRPM